MSQALSHLQTWLQSAITTGPHPAHQAQTSAHLQSTDTLHAADRLAIYEHAYRARLLKTFHSLFPGLLHAVGPEGLDAFASAFLHQQSPSHPSIDRVADGFAAYLQNTRPPPDTAPDWADFLIDLVRLDATLNEVADATGLENALPQDPAEAPTDIQLLASQPQPAPCLRLLACRYPVHDYLQTLRTGGQPPPPAARPTWLATTRVAWRIHTRELAAVQWHLLGALNGKRTLAETLQSLVPLNLQPAATPELARLWLGNFVSQGLVMEF